VVGGILAVVNPSVADTKRYNSAYEVSEQ